MARRSTIQDLAQRAGVSVSTIDRILNGRDSVRAATAARVLAAAEELSFYALPTLRQRFQAETDRVRMGFLLQQSHRTFYRTIAAAVRDAAAAFGEPVEAVVEHLDDLSPEAVAERILRLGETVRAVAVVSAEHARVSNAIETLSAAGVPTYGLISELTAACGTGYIGLDNWRVGRTAGWAVAGMCRRPGRVGIVVGNHRYRCQELNESGFRSYCREHAPDLILLEPVQTFEDNAIAREVTEQLLRREPDLVALYVAGGGMPGAIEALRSSGRAGSIVTVGNDMTEHTRLGLIDNVLTMLFAHPVQRLAQEAVAQMSRDITTGTAPGKRVLSFDIFGPENI
jgi:LacI family transcriptional regulator